MSEKPYHHGNLKMELLEKGLEFVDEHGVEELSMRKLAEVCGVSSAAPYAHFQNKEDFLIQAQRFITEQFTETLQECIATVKDKKKILLELGKRYVIFFYENPSYYHFLFSHGRVELTDYPPYQLFAEVVDEAFSEMGVKKKARRKKMLALWSMVHGLAGLSGMKGVLDGDDLEKEIEGILNAVEI